MSKALALCIAAAAVAGCHGPLASLRQRASEVTSAGAFELEYAPQSQRDAAQLRAALRAAGPRLGRWGALREPVTVRIMPSHELLEEAVGRKDYVWLRAWARYDEIYIQAPRTWGIFGATQRELDELILHELTHCLMYQLSATRTTWMKKEIPLWFREGLASVTSGQGYRWPSLEDLARYYQSHPEADPVGEADALYQKQSAIVYAAAHHATGFLLKRYGDQKVRALMRAMAEGAEFPQAFEAALGVPPAAFIAEFERYVKLRGFRAGRVRRPGPPERARPAAGDASAPEPR